MDLRLTITRVGDDRPRDVTVTAPDGHTAADLLHGLNECLGGAGSHLQSAGRPIEAEHQVGIPPLVDGASLTIGGDAAVAIPRSGQRAVLTLDVVSGPDCGHTLALTPGRHTIGRDADCSLVIADPAISRLQATVEVSSDGVRVTDLGATNPVRVVGAEATDGLLGPGDELLIGDTRLRVRTGSTRPLTSTPIGDGTIVVHRSPHVPGAPVGARLELPRRPAPAVPPRVQWLALLLPIPVCALLALLWGPQLLAFALLGPLVGGGSALAERRTARRRYAAELAAHATAAAAVHASARRTMAADLAARRREHPDPAEVARTVRETSHRLWERRPGDPPIVRVGLGPVPSRVVVVDPDRPDASEPLVLHDAPLTVDLSVTSVFGVAGARDRADAVARCLLVQLATLHSPDELGIRVVGAADPADPAEAPAADRWSWVRWLPHVRTGSDLLAAQRGRANAVDDRTAYPWTVTLVADADGSTGQESVAAIRAAAADERHVVIVVADRVDSLPAECSAVLEVGPDPARTVVSLTGHEPRPGLVVDGVTTPWAERIARRLAPLRDAGRDDATLPTTVSFATTHPQLTGDSSTDALAAGWAAPPAGLQCVLGVGVDGPLVVDLVHDGPHALVGGTTGAGKSELLRALVTGLAAAYPPEAVTFLLVDYRVERRSASVRACPTRSAWSPTWTPIWPGGRS